MSPGALRWIQKKRVLQEESRSSAARAGSRFAAGSLPDGQWPQGQEACPCQQAPSPPEQKKIREMPWLWGHCTF